MAKRKNPQDSTTRNVRASNKRDKAQNARLLAIEQRLSALEDEVSAIGFAVFPSNRKR